jgi:hypothetical protein
VSETVVDMAGVRVPETTTSLPAIGLDGTACTLNVVAFLPATTTDSVAVPAA